MMEGPGADSEEKHEPVSDIDTAVVVVGLKALDPEWPIREAIGDTADIGWPAAGWTRSRVTHFDIQTVNWCSGSSTGVHRSAGPGASYCAAAELAIQAVARHISGFQFPDVSR